MCCLSEIQKSPSVGSKKKKNRMPCFSSFCRFILLAAALILASPCFTFGLIFLPPFFCASRAPSQADAPNTGLIPESDAVGVTVVLITCTYRGQEFIRIGYYVNNEYTDPELRENPPLKPDYTQVMHTLTEQHC